MSMPDIFFMNELEDIAYIIGIFNSCEIKNTAIPLKNGCVFLSLYFKFSQNVAIVPEFES